MTSSVVVTGRLMKSSARFTTSAPRRRPFLTLTCAPGDSRSWPSVTTSRRLAGRCHDHGCVALLALDRDRPQIDGLIGFDHEHVVALLAGLHGDRRHDDRVRLGRQLQR